MLKIIHICGTIHNLGFDRMIQDQITSITKVFLLQFIRNILFQMQPENLLTNFFIDIRKYFNATTRPSFVVTELKMLSKATDITSVPDSVQILIYVWNGPLLICGAALPKMIVIASLFIYLKLAATLNLNSGLW